MFEYISEMRPFELFHECLLYSIECDARMKIWDMASTDEEKKQAESAYYSSADAVNLFVDEIISRGLEDDYHLYKSIVHRMGWVNE